MTDRPEQLRDEARSLDLAINELAQRKMVKLALADDIERMGTALPKGTKGAPRPIALVRSGGGTQKQTE